MSLVDRGENLIVLLVDDGEIDRYLFKRYLKAGVSVAQVVEKFDGEEALEFFRAQLEQQGEGAGVVLPHIVFLDVRMPRMDGFEFLAAFEALQQELERRLDIPVVMVSSSGLPEDRERAFSHRSVKEYLVKGEFQTQNLIETMDRVLD